MVSIVLQIKWAYLVKPSWSWGGEAPLVGAVDGGEGLNVSEGGQGDGAEFSTVLAVAAHQAAPAAAGAPGETENVGVEKERRLVGTRGFAGLAAESQAAKSTGAWEVAKRVVGGEAPKLEQVAETSWRDSLGKDRVEKSERQSDDGVAAHG
ncbi:hypothetical protein PGTUg99_009978 [Puccinia graminis f. sp. tritici]|uniref:Uncharacterized protein n=1 Tax=Puccinia graminis f. sp. tritici TaxID=56615 RepID=A0A5B0RSP6_PUCGR|nr:hypothetical protein PGTUg99_009978 [Puccinia graminis f. sp. tritici]